MPTILPKTSSRKTGLLLFMGIALLVAALVVLALSGTGKPQAARFLPRLNLDLRETTVSGISSGAFMAVQMAVAHSGSIKGVAVTAGGPYFCAGENSWRGLGVTQAIARCMQGDPMFPAKAITEADQHLMQATTRNWAADGLIDPVESLARQKVWIFHGYNDGTVKAPVSDALETYYRAFLPEHRIFHKRELPAAHAQISAACASDQNESGVSCNPCNVTGGNFINACPVGVAPYDAAGMALQFFYGPMQRAASSHLKGELLPFDQASYTRKDGEEIAPDAISMANTGYLYVPQSCLKGEACRLHIALHGCQQYAGKIGMDFIKGAGYNEWAEQNHLAILFPQADASRMLPVNPNGCWDWWGYNDLGESQVGHYATQNGLQIAAIWRMAQALAGSDGLDDEDLVPVSIAAEPLPEDGAEAGKGKAAKPVAPTPPRKVQLTAPIAQVLDTSSSQALLVWQAVPDAVAYRVYRLLPGLDPKDKGKAVSPENFADTAYVDSGLAEKTRYQYIVMALDEAGRESPMSQPVTAETLQKPPACDPYFSMSTRQKVNQAGLPTEAVCP